MGYSRKCECGTAFETDNFRQKRCRKGCTTKHRVRTEKRLHNDITFIGVDGEGVDRPDGAHEYVMLSVGGQTLWNGGEELSLASILEFLWKQYQATPDAAFVGFFLGYDFIQWLKLLPEERAFLLFNPAGILKRKSRRQSRANPYPDAVVWEGWEIDIMAGRRFKLRPHVHHRSEYTGLCRNRTCAVDLTEGGAKDYADDVVFDPREHLFEIPETDENSIDWQGSFEALVKGHSHMAGTGTEKVKVKGWMYICDTGPFWQTSFLKVIDPSAWGTQPICTEKEFDTVQKGKADRGMVVPRGTADYYEEMRMYNTLENDILARATTRLNQGFMNERIPIRIPKTDWYGPGRAAQLWMDQLHRLAADPEAIEHNKDALRSNAILGNARMERKNETGLLNLDVYKSMPTWFYEAAQSSYYGGWFEQMAHGHVGNTWEYDINSAYPYIIATLPCLHTSGNHNGLYLQGEGDPVRTNPNAYTLLYCTVQGSNPYIGAMPYRTQKGLISRPHVTKGWYWQHEIQASQRAGLIDTIVVERWVSYQPCECMPPFNPSNIGIEALYQLRLDFGKNTPQGKSAKLVYNSAYGKTAQSIGQPKYSNPVYASLITAGCRTLILQAIAAHPIGAGAVSMVATDGIYFLEPHPSLDIDGKRLGAWDSTEKRGLTQLMPGVYWDDETRQRIGAGEAPKLKSRGVPGGDLAKEIEKLDGLFAREAFLLKENPEHLFEWPEIRFKSKFLLESCKNALNRGKWGEAGKVTHGKERGISSNPYTKRNMVPYWDNEWMIVRTYPYEKHKNIESTPYDKSFGYMTEEDDLFGGMIDRDGRDGGAFWRELLGG